MSFFLKFVISVVCLQEREAVNLGNLYSGLEHLQPHTVRHTVPAVHQVQVK